MHTTAALALSVQDTERPSEFLAPTRQRNGSAAQGQMTTKPHSSAPFLPDPRHPVQPGARLDRDGPRASLNLQGIQQSFKHVDTVVVGCRDGIKALLQRSRVADCDQYTSAQLVLHHDFW
jgi:hypothetical protein